MYRPCLLGESALVCQVVDFECPNLFVTEVRTLSVHVKLVKTFRSKKSN